MQRNRRTNKNRQEQLGGNQILLGFSAGVEDLIQGISTVLYASVDFRNRLKPPLPGRYFGNAVLPVPARAIVGDLQSRPLSYASSKIKEAIENVTDEYVRSYLVCMKNIPEVSSSRQFHTVGYPQWLFLGNPNLLVTSLVGLGLYKAHFGWGNEIFMTPGSVGYDGRLFIIPSPNGDGSFFIPLRLQAEHINAFKKHFYEDICNLCSFMGLSKKLSHM
ncbi:hydroxycinnamoyl-CoA:piscidic acid hydroxycinnamoyltransferase-like [Coffea arabica]|uniref:Hydroxycinnamoyl-CoA:piscidic acid hydroxycinnamoyltransferase-like n=1 Tax=Coffea arabica TaxID=13443 RepID=A0ABM4W768_COFAR